MSVHPLAGKPAPAELFTNISRLVSAYYIYKPDPGIAEQRVSFGTSGHRGTSVENSFNENHVLAISQAICDYRKSKNIDGPLFLGADTHALSEPARTTAIEVFAANHVQIVIQEGLGYTPTPVISRAILMHNRGRKTGWADGVVLTPSHNPPRDGGYKYNPPSGGPAETETTRIIEQQANKLLNNNLKDVKRSGLEKALRSDLVRSYNFIPDYVQDLQQVINMDRIASAGLKLGVDPLGGSGAAFWEPIADEFGLLIEVVNPRVDPTFSFMTVDKDGKIRMDCSSPWAMAGLVRMKDKFDVAFGNDPDYDRHGIVTKSGGLMNPNHYLAVAVWYLFQNRPQWKSEIAVGKTLVSSSLIDRISGNLGRKVIEVPVGFKWFVDGLTNGTLGFCGEESAGATFLRKNGQVWTTDKDGFIMDLLAAEITAATGRDPQEHFERLIEQFGHPVYERIDAPATSDQKAALRELSPEMIDKKELAGEKIIAKITRAKGNEAPIGGLKVITKNGWFAARPSGTEDIYKIYTESFIGKDHLHKIQEEAQSIVNLAFR